MDDEFEAFDTTLRDGRAVHIRAVRDGDEAEFLQAFDRLSAAARYTRFMRAVRQPNRELLHRTLRSFPEKGICLVATVPAADGYDIVGSSMAVIIGDGTACEFAITVADDYGGTGLATTLMNTLIDAARCRGLAEMDGFVLAVNQPMLRLARRLGFDIRVDPDDGSLRICRLNLAAPAPVSESRSAG
ncbi:MAG: GNAT family N-acetyltransferase [Burkholderiaceae bacterium]|nr:GNAT family N-acetyltransferase [Burkholderiaceae bacterium]